MGSNKGVKNEKSIDSKQSKNSKFSKLSKMSKQSSMQRFKLQNNLTQLMNKNEQIEYYKQKQNLAGGFQTQMNS